ncbi:DUF4139 domain-containing protein [Kitasatospora sp. NPDC002040]|uniref:DUF4139 domain-containing protein n=1 Tax=Kitasatospora sp. NPDC002040 TaxID=3154661 RepID=UPI003318F97E
MESVLDEVVVYAAGALCRRRARGAVPADGRVRLTGLPAELDPASVRATVRGAGLRVTEARVGYETVLRSPDEMPERIRVLDLAAQEYSAAETRERRQAERIAELTALRAVPPPRHRDEPHRRTPADAWLELADFVDTRLTALQAEAARLAELTARAEHALQLAQDRLDAAPDTERTGPTNTTATVLLTLTGGSATGTEEVEFELEYGIPGAHWVPSYRLSHRQGDSGGQLVLRASVAQRTGEDWTGVRLGLSTADLQRRTELPRLRSARIGRRQTAPAPSGWREAPPGLGELFAAYDTAAPRPAPAFGFAGPVAVGGGAPAAPAAAADEDRPPVRSVSRRARMPKAAGGAAPGYGGSAEMFRGGPAGPVPAPAPMPAMAAAPMADLAAPQQFGAAPGSPPPPPEPPAPPHPGARWLDYAALTLQGPAGPDRGLLAPAPQRHRSSPAPTAAPPPHTVPPRFSAGSFDQRYDAAAPVDLPSDGSWHTVTIGEIPVSLAEEYVCVPSVEETVYGTLLLTNATDRALLAGPVEVTVDGDFLLTAALPTLAPGATRRLGLGVAEGIRAARRTELHESTAGMRNNTLVLDHRVQVELVNRLARPVTVEVRERVPVTAEPDVRLQERPGWSAPDEPSEDDPAGTRIRRVELPAHGRAELDGGYEIRIPAGKTLHGGDRRN